MLSCCQLVRFFNYQKIKLFRRYLIRDSDRKLFTKWAHGDSQGYIQNNKGKISKAETKGETESKRWSHTTKCQTRDVGWEMGSLLITYRSISSKELLNLLLTHHTDSIKAKKVHNLWSVHCTTAFQKEFFFFPTLQGSPCSLRRTCFWIVL